MRVDLTRLRADHRDLYQKLAKHRGKWQEGSVDIDPESLPWELRVELKKALGEYTPPKRDPIVTVEEGQTAVAIQRQAAEADAALKRADQLADERGFERSPQNADALRSWIETYARGAWTVHNVQCAVDSLLRHNKLVLVQAQPAPAARAALAIRVLPTGEVELPLDASESQMRAANKNQLLDLSRRRGEGRQPKQGQQTFGTNLFDRFSK